MGKSKNIVKIIIIVLVVFSICVLGIFFLNYLISDNNVIKGYYMLLFPTHFTTEGIPGTIIDSYAAGVPVIASKWDGFNDVIDNGVTGIGYQCLHNECLQAAIEDAIKSPNKIKEMKKQNVDDDFEFSYRTWKFKDEILGFNKMKMINRILLREKAPVIRSTDEKLFGHIKDEYRRRVRWIEVKQQIRLEVEKDSLKVKIVKMKALALIFIIGVCMVFWQLGTAQPVNKVVDDKIVPVDIEYGAHHVYDEVTGKLTNYGKADYIRIVFLIIGYAIYYLPKDIKLYKKIRILILLLLLLFSISSCQKPDKNEKEKYEIYVENYYNWDECFDNVTFVSIDVAFISLKLVLPVAYNVLENEGYIKVLPKKGVYVTYESNDNSSLMGVKKEIEDLKNNNVSYEDLIKIINEVYGR